MNWNRIQKILLGLSLCFSTLILFGCNNSGSTSSKQVYLLNNETPHPQYTSCSESADGSLTNCQQSKSVPVMGNSNESYSADFTITTDGQHAYIVATLFNGNSAQPLYTYCNINDNQFTDCKKLDNSPTVYPSSILSYKDKYLYISSFDNQSDYITQCNIQSAGVISDCKNFNLNSLGEFFLSSGITVNNNVLYISGGSLQNYFTCNLSEQSGLSSLDNCEKNTLSQDLGFPGKPAFDTLGDIFWPQNISSSNGPNASSGNLMNYVGCQSGQNCIKQQVQLDGPEIKIDTLYTPLMYTNGDYAYFTPIKTVESNAGNYSVCQLLDGNLNNCVILKTEGGLNFFNKMIFR